MRACSIEGDEFIPIDLGKRKYFSGCTVNSSNYLVFIFEFLILNLSLKVKPVAPFGDNLVLQSVSTALHINNGSITGQTESKATILSNPTAFITPDQPLIYLLNITDEDVSKQEEIVSMARKRIQDVLKT